MTALLCDRERHHGSRGAVFGAALAAVAVLTAPAISEARPWKVKGVQATICADGKPFWGNPKSAGFPRNALCQIFSTTLSGAVKYDGKHVWGRWVRKDRFYAGSVVNNVTWVGYWNNGGGPPEKFMDLGADGEVSGAATVSLGGEAKNVTASIQTELAALRSYWLRIDVTPDGKTKLRGGTNGGVIDVAAILRKVRSIAKR
jgi:hypothetical protein